MSTPNRRQFLQSSVVVLFEIPLARAAQPAINQRLRNPIRETLDLIIKYQLNPLRSARVLAYVSGSSALGVDLDDFTLGAHTEARMLEHFFPHEPAGKFRAMAHAASGSAVASRVDAASRMWIERALNDNTDAVWRSMDRPREAPGVWRGYPPLFAFIPTEPMAGNWKTMTIPHADVVASPPPVAYGTDAYWNEAREVMEVTRLLTPAQKEIAERWNLASGSVTPPGVWNQIAAKLLQNSAYDEVRRSQIVAILNAAMFDAFVVCWRVKYTHWTQRPITAIRERLDPKFEPYLVTPSFPSYVSGHATVSGAAEQVLIKALPEQRAAIIAMAEEAALSRLYGGIHFRSDNEQGLALGRQIGVMAAQGLALT